MVHLIFAVKYRKNLLSRYSHEVKELFFQIAEEYDFKISAMEVDNDHIHLLVKYHPKQSILDIVRLLKQISTYRLWRQNNNHLHLKKEFWMENTFWSDGYFACSIGKASYDTVRVYIEEQG